MIVAQIEGGLPGAVLAFILAMGCYGLGGTALAEEGEPRLPTEIAPREPPESALAVVEVQRAVQDAMERIETEGTDIELRFADGYDWVLTNTGEWVRGSVDWMRDNIMEFDSEEFGPLRIHMRDVTGVHAPNMETYVFKDRTSFYGRAIITEDWVVVETQAGIELRPRDTLWAIVQGGGRELDYWSTRLNLGMSANRGNSNQVDFNLRFELVREDERTLTELGYGLNLGKADGEQTVARHIVGARNRVWITRILFVEPIVGSLLSDRFQDTTLRATPAATVGVRFLDTPWVWWNVSTGPGYQYLKLYNPFVGVDNPQHDGLWRFSTRARFDITRDIFLRLVWDTNLTFTTIRNTNHTGIADLFIEVTNIFEFTASFLYLRTEDPPPRANGTVPLRNDFQLILGVALQLG